MDEFLKFIGQMIFVGGGAAAMALGLFYFLGKSLVDQKFAQALEKYKGEQTSELEKLKLKINTLFNKVVKIQDREYEILPNLWQKLVVLKLEVSRAVSMFKEMPNLDNYSPEMLEEFLVAEEIPKLVAKAIKESRNKTDEYDKYLDRRQLNNALKAFQEFDEYFNANKIFLRADIKENFTQINKKMWGAWTSRKMSMRAPNAPTDFWVKAHEQLTNEVEPLMKDIEDLVQKHLYEDQQI